MRHTKQAASGNTALAGQTPLAAAVAAVAAATVPMTSKSHSGGCRARKLGAAGKVVLAAIVHQETGDVPTMSSSDEFQSKHQSADHKRTVQKITVQMNRDIAHNTSSNSTNNNKMMNREAPMEEAKKNTHEDKGGTSSKKASKFGRLFISRKKQQQQQEAQKLIDSAQASEHQYHHSRPANGNHRHHQSSCPSLATTTLHKHCQQQKYQALDARSNVAVGNDDQQQQQQMMLGKSNNKNDREQVIEFKFDLIVDEAAASHPTGSGYDHEGGDDYDDATTTSTQNFDSVDLMKGKLNDNVNELVESFVLDSSDVCLMSIGKQTEANLNNTHHLTADERARRQQQSDDDEEFDYLGQLAAHTLAYSYRLLNSKECTGDCNGSNNAHARLSNCCSAKGVVGSADKPNEREPSTTIGNKSATTNDYHYCSHSIEVSATLFLSEDKQGGEEEESEEGEEEFRIGLMQTKTTTGHNGNSLPSTRSGVGHCGKFSIFDLLADSNNNEVDNESLSANGDHMTVCVDDLATNCDHEFEQEQQQQQQQTIAKNSPTSIDCKNFDDALATIAKVKNRLKLLLVGLKGGHCAQLLSNNCLVSGCTCEGGNMRGRSNCKKLLLISLKLKQKINGGLFSNRMCLIDFDPKFIELHSIFESIFNGQALAYLKRQKIHLRTLESTLAAAAAAAANHVDDADVAAANASIDLSLGCYDELKLKQHHQVASFTNKLIQAEWLLYKQLSSALIRTLIIVHVHKLSVPLPSISSSDDLMTMMMMPDSNSEEFKKANKQKQQFIELQRKLMCDNLILLEFARSIQRASSIRLKRRKRHLKSHLASSNVSVTSNISATTTAPNEISVGSPFRLRQSSANRSRNRNLRTGDDNYDYDYDYDHDHDDNDDYIFDRLYSQKCSMETSIAPARHSKHRHRQHRHYQQQYLGAERNRIVSGGGSSRHLSSAYQRGSHATQKQLLPSTDLTESSSLSTSSGSGQPTQQIHSSRADYRCSGSNAAIAAVDNGWLSSTPLNNNFSDSDSITSANLNSCSSSSYNRLPYHRRSSSTSHTNNGNNNHRRQHYSNNSGSNHHNSHHHRQQQQQQQTRPSRPRRDVELKWLARQSRLTRRSQFDQHELSLMSPVGPLCSSESPSTPPPAHRRSSSVSRMMSPREFGAGAIQIDCQPNNHYQRVGIVSDLPQDQGDEACVSSSSVSSTATMMMMQIQAQQSQLQTQTLISDNDHSDRTNGLEDNTDNVSDICSVIAEPPKQLKLEEFLNQLSSIIAPIASATTNTPAAAMKQTPKAGHSSNGQSRQQQQRQSSRKDSSLSLLPPASQSSGRQVNEQPEQGERQQANCVQCSKVDADKLIPIESSSNYFVNSNGPVAVVDEDEEDCKSHSSILEHLSSLAIESNSKLSNRQQQQQTCCFDQFKPPANSQATTIACEGDFSRHSSISIGRQLTLEMTDHDFDSSNSLGVPNLTKGPTGHLQRMLNSSRRGSFRVLVGDMTSPSSSAEDKLRTLSISCQQAPPPSSPSASSGAFTSSNDSSCSSSSSVVAERHSRRAITTSAATGGLLPLSKSNSLTSQHNLYASVIRGNQNVKI